LLWIAPIAISGFRRRIEDPERVPELPDDVCARNLVPRAIDAWQKELKEKKKGKRRLWRVIFRISWPYVVIGAFMSVIQGIVTTVVRPLLIRMLIDELGGDRNENELLTTIFLLAAALIVEGISSVGLKHSLSDFMGTIWVTSTGALVHAQAMKIPGGLTNLSESGLLGNDLIRTYENMRFFCLLPMSIIALIGGIVVLVITIGEASLIGLAVMCSILGVNSFLARKAQTAEEEDLSAADARLSLLEEVVKSIKAIKLSALENNFADLVREKRNVEMVALRRYRTLAQTTVQLGRACPPLCAGASFIYLSLVSDQVNASDIFAALNVFLALRLPLILIPESVTYIGALLVTLKRLEKYLELDPVQKLGVVPNEGSNDEASEFVIQGSFSWYGSRVERGIDGMNTELSMKKSMSTGGTSFRKSETEMFTSFCLQNLDLRIPRGSTVAIISPVGQGKTSLIAAMMGELASYGETVNTFAGRRIAFVPQHTFVLSGSIRENILFGKPCPPGGDSAFEGVLRESALLADIRALPYGLDTVVGERGITLSGGQKARLSVARGLFHKPELCFFDDVLAAVDAPIAKHMVKNVIEKKASETTLIVSLNQIQYLGSFDFVIQLDRGSVRRAQPLDQQLVEKIQKELKDLLEKAENEEGEKKPEDTGELSMKNDVRATSALSEISSVLSMRGDEQGTNELVQHEIKGKGTVKWDIIGHYAKGMGLGNIALGVTVGLATYSTMALTDLWLARYVGLEDATERDDVIFSSLYAAGSLSFLTLLVTTSVIFSRAGVRASKHLHQMIMMRILRAPISWHESIPSGRILSRFSTDIGIVDQNLSRFTDNVFQLFATTCALVVVVIVLVPPASIVIVISAIFFSMQVLAIDKSNREIKRNANLAMSPIQTILAESVQGRMSLRAYDARGPFLDRFMTACDDWNRQSFTSLSMINFSMLMAYVLSFAISTSTGLFIVYSEAVEPADAGLAMSYANLIPYFCLHMAFVVTIVQTALASLERVLDFIGPSVPQEKAWRLETDPPTKFIEDGHKLVAEGHRFPEDEESFWPQQATIEFQEVTLVYREGLPPAIKGVSFSIKHNERVAFVGKSGAGKSSLTLLLLRVQEATSGRILIGDVDISGLGLLTLREVFNVIPQDPLLLQGTIRFNLDTFGDFGDDAVLANSLVEAGLVRSQEAGLELLDLDLASQSLSAGQRQLISFARAILRPKAILLADEMSAFVDTNTDAAIQRVLRTKAKGTKIVIAHRLETVVDSDTIFVFDQGKLVESGAPQYLLTIEDGYFRNMAQAANISVDN